MPSRQNGDMPVAERDSYVSQKLTGESWAFRPGGGRVARFWLRDGKFSVYVIFSGCRMAPVKD
jgi:hypothetical protein